MGSHRAFSGAARRDALNLTDSSAGREPQRSNLPSSIEPQNVRTTMRADRERPRVASADLAAHDDSSLAVRGGVGGGGAGGEKLPSFFADLLIVGVVATEAVGVVCLLLTGDRVDHADLPEAFFHTRHVGKVGVSVVEGPWQGPKRTTKGQAFAK